MHNTMHARTQSFRLHEQDLPPYITVLSGAEQTEKASWTPRIYLKSYVPNLPALDDYPESTSII